MLATLRVQNLGAVDDAVLELDTGLTVLTGETGAGKTLLVEALHLVLGGSDRGLPVRDPSSPSRVEALFTDGAGTEVVLARERAVAGRLRASLDGQLASAQSLTDRAGALCELHGQHEHQVLRTPGAARALLDRAGSIDDGDVVALRSRRRALLAAREALGGSAAERLRRLELATHEAAEIDAVAPSGPDEVESLLEEASVVAEVLDSRDALVRAAGVLDGEGDDPAAASLVATALGLVPRGLASTRDELAEVLERVRSLAGALRDEVDQLDEDPARLEALNDRLARLQALVRKHGQRLDDVLRRREELTVELASLHDDERRALRADAELVSIQAELAAAERRILALREEAGLVLTASVRSRLAPLAMPHASFEVAVSGPAGEDVQFLFAGSAAFEPAPLAEVASGGELSRVMLALTLATHGGTGTLVFDEVDAGVGGATARSLAVCLDELARDVQVLVVTHLATVAAVASHHLVVTRGEDASAPTTIEPVTGRARVEEVARMLAGDPLDPVALSHAEALLGGDPAVA